MILRKWIGPAGQERSWWASMGSGVCTSLTWLHPVLQRFDSTGTHRLSQEMSEELIVFWMLTNSLLKMTRRLNEQISGLSPETYQMSPKVWHIKTKLEQLSAIWNVWNVPGNGRVCYKWANTSHFLWNTERPAAFSQRVKEFVIAGVLPLLSLLWVTCLSQRGFLLSVLDVLFLSCWKAALPGFWIDPRRK